MGATAGILAFSTSYSTSLPGYLWVRGEEAAAGPRSGRPGSNAPTADAGPRLFFRSSEDPLLFGFLRGGKKGERGVGEEGGETRGEVYLFCFCIEAES